MGKEESIGSSFFFVSLLINFVIILQFPFACFSSPAGRVGLGADEGEGIEKERNDKRMNEHRMGGSGRTPHHAFHSNRTFSSSGFRVWE